MSITHTRRVLSTSLLLLAATTLPGLAQAQDFLIDHFRCYHTEGEPIGVTVALMDQFDVNGSFDKALVRQAVRFCNPTKKAHAGVVVPIRNPDAHLKMYSLEQFQVDPNRVVLVSNQFGKEQKIRLGQPVILAVPTQKRPHAPPQRLDHFQCYRARGEGIFQAVGLSDQFTGAEVKVLEPQLFCNPVVKIHNGVTVPIENRRDHLTCYATSVQPFEIKAETRDQFLAEVLLVHDPDLLCVPSHKLHWEEV